VSLESSRFRFPESADFRNYSLFSVCCCFPPFAAFTPLFFSSIEPTSSVACRQRFSADFLGTTPVTPLSQFFFLINLSCLGSPPRVHLPPPYRQSISPRDNRFTRSSSSLPRRFTVAFPRSLHLSVRPFADFFSGRVFIVFSLARTYVFDLPSLSRDLRFSEFS